MKDLKEIIKQTVDEILSELGKCSIQEEIPQSEEDNTMMATNMSTATWREGAEMKDDMKVIPPASTSTVSNVSVVNGTDMPLKISGIENIITIRDSVAKSYVIKIERA